MKLPNSSESKSLVLFDAYHYLHRAYHALPELSNKQGQPVGAVLGFAKTILKLLKKLKPAYFAVCWDSQPIARLTLDPNYKANRGETPNDLRSQIALARKFIHMWGLPELSAEGVEADDLMASAALSASQKGIEVILVSSDKDLMQLVDGRIRVYLEHKEEWMDAAKVEGKFGVPPERLRDYFALVGDATDNIPGIPGVGPKTAQSLLQKFSGVESLLAAAGNPQAGMPEKIRANLLSHGERLKINKTLVTLDTSLTKAWTPEDFEVPKQAQPGFKETLMELGFASLLNEFKALDWIAASNREQPALPQTSNRRIISDTTEKESSSWLTDPGITKIVYDCKNWLRRHPQWAGRIRAGVLDIKILAWMVNPSEESYALDWLMDKYGAENLDALAGELERRLEEAGLKDLYESLELPLMEVLLRMEQCGIAVDRGYLENLDRDWTKQMDECRSNFLAATGAGPDLNLNSPKQLAVLLFEKMKLPVVKKTKTGYSTDEEVLNKLAQGHPEIKSLLEHRELAKLRSTYIEGLLSALDQADGKIHATFHQEGTQTGRVSCTNPNLQNIPVRSNYGLAVRRAFIPSEPDWEFLSLDYSQIDLRVFAHLSADPELIRFFQDGRDIHEETARALLSNGGEVSPEMRRQAKAINFGILYGMGSWGLARALSIDPAKAEEIISVYYQRFPGVDAWRQQIIEGARRDGFVKTMLGRIRFLENINSERRDLREFSERAAVNTPVQGSSADIVKKAMLRLDQEMRQRRVASRMLIQVHDEILLEGPGEELRGLTADLKRAMREAMVLRVPLEVHAKIGKNWRDLVPF